MKYQQHPHLILHVNNPSSDLIPCHHVHGVHLLSFTNVRTITEGSGLPGVWDSTAYILCKTVSALVSVHQPASCRRLRSLGSVTIVSQL